MIRKLALASVLIGTGLFFVPQITSAAAVSIPGKVASQRTLIEKVQWRYCRYWHHECARRWPWLGWRYDRCLRIHGC